MESSEVDEFLSGTLMTWFISCIKDQHLLTTYGDLVDGVLLHSVYLQIDPQPLRNDIYAANGNANLRIKNLESIVENVRQFYEERLGSILLKSPSATNLGKDPESHIEDMKLLLLLILGCAIQCQEKEIFITKIKTLPEITQLKLVEYIKLITDHQEIVVSKESLENANMGALFTHVKNLIYERNYYYDKSQNLDFTDIEIQGNSTVITSHCEELTKSSHFNSSTKSDIQEVHNCSELAEWKIKFRKLQLEFEEKSEAFSECKGENEYKTMLLTRLTQENQQLTMEARTAKSYRDELDAAIEKAQKVDRLEMEICRYREKMISIDFYKSRIEELHEDNRVLMEMKDTLEEELNSHKKQFAKIHDFEDETLQLKKLLNSISLERAADRERYEQLHEEHFHLQCFVKSKNEVSITESLNYSVEPEIMNHSLLDQLQSSAQTRSLQLELENRRLSSEIQSMKGNSSQREPPQINELQKDGKEHKSDCLVTNEEWLVQGNSDSDLISRIEELENVEKESKLIVDSLIKNNEELTQINANLDYTCNSLIQENQCLERALKSFMEERNDHVILELQHEELSNDYLKLVEERDDLKKKMEKSVLKIENLTIINEEVQSVNERLSIHKEKNNFHEEQNNLLMAEYERLQADFKSSFNRGERLHLENEQLSRLNTDVNNRLSEAINENLIKEAKCANLELQVFNLNERCVEFNLLNSELNNEKTTLMNHVKYLTSQNNELFMHLLEEKEHFHSEEKKYQETIAHMNYMNNKLENKVMEFYKTLPSTMSNSKKNSFRSTLLKKVKKAGAKVTRRASWAPESSRPNDRSSEFDRNLDQNFPSDQNMSLDPPRFSRLRDRLSSVFTRNRKSSNSPEETSASSTENYITPEPFVFETENENGSTDAASNSKTESITNGVFEVQADVHNENSVISANNNETEDPEESEAYRDLENYLNTSTNTESKASVWVGYGCV